MLELFPGSDARVLLWRFERETNGCVGLICALRPAEPAACGLPLAAPTQAGGCVGLGGVTVAKAAEQ